MSATKIGSNIRLDPELRKKLTEGLANVGLTVNGYFTMAAKQFIIQGKVPFEIKNPPKVKCLIIVRQRYNDCEALQCLEGIFIWAVNLNIPQWRN